MTIRTVSEEELEARLWDATVAWQEAGEVGPRPRMHIGAHEADVRVGETLYVARLPIAGDAA